MQKSSYLLLALILIVSLLLGSRMIFASDFFFLADQARDMLLTQDIVENRNITLIGTHSGLGGFFHGPLWLYLLIPFYLVGGGDSLAFTYAYVMIALVTVLVGYFVGTSLYGKKVGLVFAFLLAVSPSVWEYVPNTIGVNMVPLVFLPMFYFLIRYMRGDQKGFIFAVFFAGLSLQFETALPLILFPVVFLSFFLNKKAIKNVKIILLSIASFLLSLATFILFDVRHDFSMTKSLLTIFSGGKHEQGYMAFPERLLNHLQSLKGVYESLLIHHTLLLQLLLIGSIIVFGFLAVKKHLYKKKEWKEFLYLTLFPVFIFVFYSFYAYPVFPEYILGLTIPVALAFALISRHLWQHIIGKIVFVLFVAVTLFEASTMIYTNYFTPYEMNTTAGSYQNQKEVAEWILNDSNKEQFGYFVYTPSTYTYGMDYLLWWEAKIHGQAKPESVKHKLTYLILYPTLENDLGAHTFWKRTKVRTNAKVMEKKQFEGGIIVEKLSVDPKEAPADATYQQNLIFR